MTDKQKEALKKAQAAAVAKREAEKQTTEVPKLNSEIPYKDLSDKIDKLTDAVLGMKQVLEEIAKNQPAKLDLTFLRK